MNGTVNALTVYDSGNLYAGGKFTTAGGVAAKYIAEWDGSSWSPLGSGMSSSVHALVVDAGGNLFAGGSFITVVWLHGTTFPSWAGNSAIIAYMYDANGQPGLFNDLIELKWGDEVIVHAYGQDYVYEVRTVEKYIRPGDTSSIFKHEDFPWLTLITCRGYDEDSDSYSWRVVVRAVQVDIK